MPCCDRSRATVACSAPTAQSHARRSKQAFPAARKRHPEDGRLERCQAKLQPYDFSPWPTGWLANRTFRTAYPMMLKHPACSEALFAAVAPQPGDRILMVRNAHAPSVVPFAGLHPEARFVSLEPDEASFLAAEREIQALGAVNIEISRPGEAALLPYAAALFDKVVSLMTLHTAMPEPRLALVREMLRVIRRKGLFYAADIDAATTAAERNFLRITHFALGGEQVQPHVDGIWPGILPAAGSRA